MAALRLGKKSAAMAGMRDWMGRYRAWSILGCSALSFALLPLTGCTNFFQCEDKPACPASTSTSGSGTSDNSTVDFAFVSYTTTAGTPVITGYNVASGALTAVNTVTLPFIPVSMAVNPANTLLYVASVPGATNPGIYAYSIGSDGTLTATDNGAAVMSGEQSGAITISPDGNYLFSLLSTGLVLNEYKISSSGGLTISGELTIEALSCGLSTTTPVLPTCSVAVSPADNYVVASYGTQGSAVFSYSSSSGIPNSQFTTVAAGTASGDFSTAIDENGNAYIARTSTMGVYALGSLIASPTTYAPSIYTYATGSIPRSTVVSPSAKFVYTADAGISKITGFATGTTTVTPLAGSSFAAPASVAAIGVDSSETYLVAAGYDATAGVQLYSIASTGVPTVLKSAGTSTATQYPVLVAMSH